MIDTISIRFKTMLLFHKAVLSSTKLANHDRLVDHFVIDHDNGGSENSSGSCKQ